jgi:hypothetical protein
MKTRFVLLLLLVGIFAFVSCASTAGTIAPADFPRWVEEEGIWRTVVPAAWKRGAENAPTDEQINNIINMGLLAPTSGGSNDTFFLVIRDVEMQRDVVGPNNANEATVMIMVFADRILEDHPRVPWSPDRGYTNAGIAIGYMNVAAFSQGLGTRMYFTPSGYYGNRPWIPAYTATATKPHIESVYLRGMGYRYHVSGNYGPNPTGSPDGAYYDPYGNMKWVLSIIVGNLDTTADTQVTSVRYPRNVVFVN